jgi:hypothetical protein
VHKVYNSVKIVAIVVESKMSRWLPCENYGYFRFGEGSRASERFDTETHHEHTYNIYYAWHVVGKFMTGNVAAVRQSEIVSDKFSVMNQYINYDILSELKWNDICDANRHVRTEIYEAAKQAVSSARNMHIVHYLHGFQTSVD